MAIQPEIKTVNTKVVYENKWMTVREDEILRPSGHSGIYGLVEKSDFAVIAAVQNDLIYLVEQYRYPVKGRYWEFPQGSVDDKGANPLLVATTELREETGLIAGTMMHAGHLFLACGFTTQGYDIFFATDLQQHSAQIEPEEEGLITRTFPIKQFEQMLVNGEIKDASTIAAFGLLRLKGLL